MMTTTTTIRNRWLYGTLALGLSVALACGNITACGSDSGASNFGSSGSSGSTASSSSGFNTGDSGPGSTEQFAKIVITPADPVVDVAFNAKTPVTAFTATGVRADNTQVPLTGGVWNFTRIDAAGFNGNQLVPTGFIGGKGTVNFTIGTQSGSTTASFKLHITDGTVPAPNVVAAFTNATDADGVMALVYPYDKTVFPRGFPTPVIQWNGATNDTDIYKITATGDTFDFVGYSTIAKPCRYPFSTTPVDIWAKLTDSTTGNLSVGIQRYDGVKAYKAETQTWGIAGGNLKGTIYYTRLIGDETTGGSFVRRIEPGKIGESFLEVKADSPTTPGGTQCIACHSVSRDGSRIVAAVNGGASPWATYDAVTGKELYRSLQASGFQAISPTGSHVIWRTWSDASFGTEGILKLSTYDNDAVLATLTLPAGVTGGPGHPAWSPDGNKVAFSVRTAGDGLNFTASTLWTTDVSLMPTPGFANTKKIIDANATYAVVTYPTWSPDSNWLAFMRANQSRSDGNGQGELWMSSADGVTQVRLDAANGVPDVSATPNASWGPSMHPVAAGGYFWLAFFSRRPYGNTFNGVNRQLWLAAVDANPVAGKDPSHPAFYVTGQDTDSTNERPQFTVNPCKPLGSSCENGYDCCDGYCRAGDDGGLTCQQKSNVCAQDGDKCVIASDCCNGSQCIGGFCATPPPK